MNLLDTAGPPLAIDTVVSIGMFDGVHSGHRSLLTTLRERGLQLGLPTVVLTFDPHPRLLLQPSLAPRMLSNLDDRLALLAATGMVDYCLVLPFDRRRSEEPVDTFVQETLVGQLRMRALVVGDNFACGRGRRGDISYLQSVGPRHGFKVHPVALRHVPAVGGLGPCSSTTARRLIETGDVGSAALLLGRPHELTGAVVGVSMHPAPALDVLLPENLCEPPVDHYFGAVRPLSREAPWTPATFSVAENHSTGRRSVRVQPAVEASCGELVGMRFYSQAAGRAHSGSAVAG